MFYRIGCYTLFDITQTGVLNRSRPPENSVDTDWLLKRNQQANFDSIVQAISLRSQPENISKPQRIKLSSDVITNLGLNYKLTEKVYCWTFFFNVSFAGIYDNGIEEFGHLYSDVNGVPMVYTNSSIENLPNFIRTDLDLKNIYFVKYSDES